MAIYQHEDVATCDIFGYLHREITRSAVQDRWIVEFSSRGFLANQERGVRHVQRGENGEEQGGSVEARGLEHRPHALRIWPQPPI